MTKMTAEQVVAELEQQRALYYAAMDMMDDLCDTDEYESYEATAQRISAAIGLIRNHLIETDEQRRERFEAWWRSDCRSRGANERMDRDDLSGMYVGGVIAKAWQAWQAALTWRGETKGGE